MPAVPAWPLMSCTSTEPSNPATCRPVYVSAYFRTYATHALKEAEEQVPPTDAFTLKEAEAKGHRLVLMGSESSDAAGAGAGAGAAAAALDAP